MTETADSRSSSSSVELLSDRARQVLSAYLDDIERLQAQLAAQTAAIEVARQQVAHCEVCRVNIREALARGQHRGERVMGRGSWAMVIKSWSCRLENHSNCDGQVVLERDERVNLHVVNCGCDCHQPAANTTREEQG